MPHQETLTRSILASLLAVLLAVSIGCKKAASPPAPEPATSTEGHSPFGIAIVDSHVHIFPTMPALARALEVFDRVGIRQFVAKSGGDWGSPRFTATVAMKRVPICTPAYPRSSARAKSSGAPMPPAQIKGTPRSLSSA